MNQAKFEAHCIEQLRLARDVARARGAVLEGDIGDDSVESLCWKHDNGNYGVLQIQAAWIGYQWAMVDAVVPERQQVSEPCDFT